MAWLSASPRSIDVFVRAARSSMERVDADTATAPLPIRSPSPPLQGPSSSSVARPELATRVPTVVVDNRQKSSPATDAAAPVAAAAPAAEMLRMGGPGFDRQTALFHCPLCEATMHSAGFRRSATLSKDTRERENATTTPGSHSRRPPSSNADDEAWCNFCARQAAQGEWLYCRACEYYLCPRCCEFLRVDGRYDEPAVRVCRRCKELVPLKDLQRNPPKHSCGRGRGAVTVPDEEAADMPSTVAAFSSVSQPLALGLHQGQVAQTGSGTATTHTPTPAKQQRPIGGTPRKACTVVIRGLPLTATVARLEQFLGMSPGALTLDLSSSDGTAEASFDTQMQAWNALQTCQDLEFDGVQLVAELV